MSSGSRGCKARGNDAHGAECQWEPLAQYLPSSELLRGYAQGDPAVEVPLSHTSVGGPRSHWRAGKLRAPRRELELWNLSEREEQALRGVSATAKRGIEDVRAPRLEFGDRLGCAVLHDPR